MPRTRVPEKGGQRRAQQKEEGSHQEGTQELERPGRIEGRLDGICLMDQSGLEARPGKTFKCRKCKQGNAKDSEVVRREQLCENQQAEKIE
ncbi:MAG TPA: hypothetical protein PK014_07145 [Thermoanaerobaculia bacterium]|nr:hypothetical protein [Thermoanaerobaculia bacterium]